MASVSASGQDHGAAVGDGRIGIIDIGSNSVRLVVYAGLTRVPGILFNEKVMAGLGRQLASTGALDPEAVERTLSALNRFQLLAEQMQVSSLRTVATAAVRDASNGREFLDRLESMGLHPELLSGQEEARLAGEGVLSGIPEADGVVGDLGGGSLELAQVGDGRVLDGASFPLGVLRLGGQRKGGGPIIQRVGQILEKAGWTGRCEGRPFYLVGGSWRALGRLHMNMTRHQLPILHNYRVSVEEAVELVQAVDGAGASKRLAVSGVSSSRLAMLPQAATMLMAMIRHLRPSELIISANGLREGLLFSSLPDDIRRIDPLIYATREEGRVRGRFGEHGDMLFDWTSPLFEDDPAPFRRLRHAACLLADTGWHAHPEFRAERGLEEALHSNWSGLDAHGRAMIAQALYVNFGGVGRTSVLSQLCSPDDLKRAERWGLALRLGQRLSGGVAPGLAASRLSLEGDRLVLGIAQGDASLNGESVGRRLKALASAMGREPEVRTF